MKELKAKLEVLQKKVDVKISMLNGSFDRKDKNRVSKKKRLRRNREELEKEKNGDLEQRLKDWYEDIDKGIG